MKSCSLLCSFVLEFNSLFRNDFSDSLSLAEGILKIVFDVFILFFTAFDVISMLLFSLFFCQSAPLSSKRFENLILLAGFCVVFDFNLAVRRGLFYGEVVYNNFFCIFFFVKWKCCNFLLLKTSK